ncbi:hypothetical protein [Caenispirillum salinarum]|uniref:hypothetical protein n=1 Tax=Caenispirillum salinarum TaxID=859058 RepID=UPI00384E36E9
MRFSFRGHDTGMNLGAIIAGDEGFAAARRRMTDELGFPPEKADRILADMLGTTLLRYGSHLVREKSDLVAKVVDLRDRLDTLYSELLNFERRDGSGGRVSGDRDDLDTQLRKIEGLYSELDAALKDLGTPFHGIEPPPDIALGLPEHLLKEIRETDASVRTQDRRDVTADLTPTKPGRRSRIEGGRYTFKRNADGSYTRIFADDASVRFRVRNGRYHVETFDPSGNKQLEFSEFDVLQSPYERRPRTTALMQCHHGLQNSLMTKLFKAYNYDGGAAPTIWLRNSRRGSPHGSITAVQNGQKSTRNAAGITFEDIREWAIADLRITQMPEHKIAEYLAVFDAYFESAVLPNIPKEKYDELLGNWRPK